MRYLAFFLASIIIIACNDVDSPPPGVMYGEVNSKCPPYDSTTILTWFPCKVKDSFVYKDSSGHEYTLTIDSTIYPDGAGGPPCYRGGRIQAVQDDTISDIEMEVLESNYPTTYKAHIKWQGYSVFMYYMSMSKVEIDERCLPEYHSTITLNGKSYNEVYEAVLYPYNSEYGKIYIARGYGVVGFMKDSSAYWLQH